MERALNLDLLRAALGEGGMFPSPEELQRRLAEAEIALFLQRGAIDDELLATAWYLHGVGTTRASLQIYPVERQRRANQVAAHIFDLALSAGIESEVVRREMTFAAQVSYLRGDLDPNALALYRRLPRSEPRLRDEPGAVSLDVGSAVLALDRRRLFGGRLRALRREATPAGPDRRRHRPHRRRRTGAAARVIEGCNNLIVHLTYNQPDRLDRARQLFDEGTDPPFAQFDLDSRWVAAHLRDIADDLGTTSVWAHLPPSVPPAAARAMTLGDPPVLSLWPPQLELLNGTPNPLDPAVRRLVLSFPTSAGKTLMAQYIVAAHVASGAGSACVVVPTHSLGRELRRDLDRRLSTIGRQAEDAGPLGLPLPAPPSAVVMTPEKLAAHLRLEPNRMLSEYSLYVIDEAHLVGDAERGWVLESALGFLHGATLHHEPPDRGALRRAGQPGPRGGLAGGRRPAGAAVPPRLAGPSASACPVRHLGGLADRRGAHPTNPEGWTLARAAAAVRGDPRADRTRAASLPADHRSDQLAGAGPQGGEMEARSRARMNPRIGSGRGWRPCSGRTARCSSSSRPSSRRSARPRRWPSRSRRTIPQCAALAALASTRLGRGAPPGRRAAPRRRLPSRGPAR